MWGHADPRSLRARGAPSQPALYLHTFGLFLHVDGNVCQRGTMHPCWEALRSSFLPERRPCQQAVLCFTLDLCVVFFPSGTQARPGRAWKEPTSQGCRTSLRPGQHQQCEHPQLEPSATPRARPSGTRLARSREEERAGKYSEVRPRLWGKMGAPEFRLNCTSFSVSRPPNEWEPLTHCEDR